MIAVFEAKNRNKQVNMNIRLQYFDITMWLLDYTILREWIVFIPYLIELLKNTCNIY